MPLKGGVKDFAKVGWTSDKLLKGAGAGASADPTEIDVPAAKSIATGSYTGDGTDSRQITTGFKCSMVFLTSLSIVNGRYRQWVAIPNAGHMEGGDTDDTFYGLTLHATNGFQVNSSYANQDTIVYYYWAISE